MSTKNLLIEMLYDRDCEVKKLKGQNQKLSFDVTRLTTEIQNRPTKEVYVPQDEVNALIHFVLYGRGQTSLINAIKTYRQLTNCGLKEAKDAVESFEQQMKEVSSNDRNNSESP